MSTRIVQTYWLRLNCIGKREKAKMIIVIDVQLREYKTEKRSRVSSYYFLFITSAFPSSCYPGYYSLLIEQNQTTAGIHKSWKMLSNNGWMVTEFIFLLFSFLNAKLPWAKIDPKKLDTGIRIFFQQTENNKLKSRQDI